MYDYFWCGVYESTEGIVSEMQSYTLARTRDHLPTEKAVSRTFNDAFAPRIADTSGVFISGFEDANSCVS